MAFGGSTCGLRAAEEQSAPEATLESVLTVPPDFVSARVHNGREAELLHQVSSTASKFSAAISVYEVLALKLDALKKSWDELWLSTEPVLSPAIRMVGHAMSQQNGARGRVLQQVEELAACLEGQAAALTQFADMRADLARELSAEGLHKLAADKLLLSTVEQELAARITSICAVGEIARFRPMSEFVDILQASFAKPQEPPVPVGSQESPIAAATARSGDHQQDQQATDDNSAAAPAGTAVSLSKPGVSAARQEVGGVGVTNPAGRRSLEGQGVTTGNQQGERSRQERGAQQPGEGAALRQAEAERLPHDGMYARQGISEGIHPDGHSRKRPRDADEGEGQGMKVLRMDSAAGQMQAPRTAKQLEAGRGSLAAVTPIAAATCLVRERCEREAGGKVLGLLEANGTSSQDMQAGAPPDLSTASEKAPASGGGADQADPGLDGEAGSLWCHPFLNSPERGPQLKDGSLSSRERQLLTDERLTPSSPSASRSPLTPTQTPPSSSRGQPTPTAPLLGTEAGISMQAQVADSPASAGPRSTRLSNASSSPSKSPGSVKLSQTDQQGEGGPGRGPQDEQAGKAAAEDACLLAHVLPAGRGSADAPVLPHDVEDGELRGRVMAGEERETVVHAAAGEGEHEQHRMEEAKVFLGTEEQVWKAGEETAPTGSHLPEKIPELTRPNAEPSAEWLEPPVSDARVWAHEQQCHGAASQPESGTQTQSMQAAGPHGAAEDRVPDSEETRSQSSGRGGAAGPTPPPWSRISSHGDKHGVTGEAAYSEDKADGKERAEQAACSAELGASQGEWDEEMTQSGATELVPETEDMEEDSPQRVGDQDTLPLQAEATRVASPCRTQESPPLSGSHPASQSPIF